METKTGNGNAVTLQKLVDDLKVVVHDSEELIRSRAGQVRERAIAGARAADERIRKNPYPSLGLVLGAGLLLGVLAFNLFSSQGKESWESED
ncbi:MAG: hypothetical protein JWR19_3060 [Pedosphaera sp.]|nr:hypothetical protein [Pedosphaera sp.]